MNEVKEKLIETLGRYVSEPPCNTCKTPIGHCDRCGLDRLADHLLANGVTIQKWIPVTERLPETGKRIIVCRGDKVEQGIYLGVNGWWKVYGANTKAVTHWMPLPEPPKEEI